MNSAIWLSTFCALVLILTGCTNSHSRFANDPLGTGPFDSRGNYREDWVDDPSKWTKPGRRQQADDLPVIAKNEEPPPNANPLAPGRASTPKPPPPPPKTQAQADDDTLHRQKGRHAFRDCEPVSFLRGGNPPGQRHFRFPYPSRPIAGGSPTLTICRVGWSPPVQRSACQASMPPAMFLTRVNPCSRSNRTALAERPPDLQ